MEEYPNASDEHRAQAAERAKFVLDIACVKLDGQPLELRNAHLKAIAYSAAGEGVWEQFSDYYGRERSHDFIFESDAAKPMWAEQFAKAGDFAMAEAVTSAIKNCMIQEKTIATIAEEAAKAGDTAVTYRYSPNEYTSSQPTRSGIMGSLYFALSKKGDWEMADSIKEEESLLADDLFRAAHAAACQNDLARFSGLLNEAFDDNNVADLTLLKDATVAAVKQAYLGGNFGFINDLENNVGLPDVVLEQWRQWIDSGIVLAIHSSNAYESGINFYIGQELEKSQKTEVYVKLQNYLECRNWDEIISSVEDYSYKILGMLYFLADQEGQFDPAEELKESIAEGKFFDQSGFPIDEILLVIFNEATKGDWEYAIDNIGLLADMPDEKYDAAVCRLIRLAILQQEDDVLEELIGHDEMETRLAMAHDLMQAQGRFDDAQQLLTSWLMKYPAIFCDEDSSHSLATFGLQTIKNASMQSNWEIALDNLSVLDRVQAIDEPIHMGYVKLAVAALKIVRSAVA